MAESEKYIPKTPADLFKSRSAVVHHYLQLWKLGQLSWEQMLLELACSLIEQTDNLVTEIVQNARQNPKPFIVPK